MKMTTVILEEDENGDLILPIPVDILNQMGWDVGDELIFKELNDVAWSMKKVVTDITLEDD